MKLWFSVIVLTCFTQVESTFFDCSSFWPFTILGFCPIHTRVVTRVGDSKSADKNTTEIGPKEQGPENATSAEISTVKTTVATTSEGTTESVMNVTTQLPEDKTTPANSEMTMTTSASTSPPQDSTTATIAPTTTQKTETPEDKATTKIPTATTDETTTKESKEKTTLETTEKPKETTVSEENKDETVSEAPTEDTSPVTKAKTDKVKPTETAKSTVKTKDSDDDDSDDDSTDKITEATTEGIAEAEIESAAEDPKVFYEETISKKAPTKALRKTNDKGDARNQLNVRPTPSTAKQSPNLLSSRIKGLPSQLKPPRQQLVKSNGAVKVSGASNPVIGDNPINNYYGSSFSRENE